MFMKISKYNMPWGVLVALKAGDMQCTVIFNLANNFFFYFILHLKPSPRLYLDVSFYPSTKQAARGTHMQWS